MSMKFVRYKGRQKARNTRTVVAQRMLMLRTELLWWGRRPLTRDPPPLRFCSFGSDRPRIYESTKVDEKIYKIKKRKEGRKFRRLLAVFFVFCFFVLFFLVLSCFLQTKDSLPYKSCISHLGYLFRTASGTLSVPRIHWV